MLFAQCYIQNLRSIKKNKGEKVWDTQKSIEVEEKWVQKKEELVKETRENRINSNYNIIYITNEVR